MRTSRTGICSRNALPRLSFLRKQESSPRLLDSRLRGNDSFPFSIVRQKFINFAFCNSRRGFTLLELIVVLFIISLVAAIVLPSFAGFGDSKLKSEAREIASILRYMNDSAISRKETFLMKFNLDKNTVYWMGPDEGRTKRFDDITGVTTQSNGKVSEGEITLFFGPFGIQENLSVHIGKGDKEMTVTLNHLSGKVKIVQNEK